jgi:Uma2 family endonuclease
MSTLTPTLPTVAVPPPSVPVATRAEVVIDGRVRIPPSVCDLATFRQWAKDQDPWPDHTRFAYLAGIIWVEQSMEQAYTHNDVKTEFASVLKVLARTLAQGRYFGDGMLISIPTADLSTVPDGLFILHSTFDSGGVREVAGRHPGVIEFEGTLDMALEVVSDSSEEKDLQSLPVLYHRAGIAEFWRADARGQLRFEVFRWTDAGYVSTRLEDGWNRSELFGREFLLTQQPDARGRPDYILQVRPIP